VTYAELRDSTVVRMCVLWRFTVFQTLREEAFVQNHATFHHEQQPWIGNHKRSLRTVSSLLSVHLLAGILLGGLFFAHDMHASAETPASEQNLNSRGDKTGRPLATLIVFYDNAIPDGLLPAVDAALRQELTSDSPEVRKLIDKGPGSTSESGSIPRIKILSQKEIVPSVVVENPITVYLHGECKILPLPAHELLRGILVSGPLGWAPSDHGRILPFIHVNCDRLAEMLSTTAFGRHREQRNQLMALAISKVILHEWIHIATQNPRHSKRGIEQAAFGVKDLIADPASQAIQAKPHAAKHSSYADATY
jgi:hypothetical protein